MNLSLLSLTLIIFSARPSRGQTLLESGSAPGIKGNIQIYITHLFELFTMNE